MVYHTMPCTVFIMIYCDTWYYLVTIYDDAFVQHLPLFIMIKFTMINNGKFVQL